MITWLHSKPIYIYAINLIWLSHSGRQRSSGSSRDVLLCTHICSTFNWCTNLIDRPKETITCCDSVYPLPVWVGTSMGTVIVVECGGGFVSKRKRIQKTAIRAIKLSGSYCNRSDDGNVNIYDWLNDQTLNLAVTVRKRKHANHKSLSVPFSLLCCLLPAILLLLLLLLLLLFSFLAFRFYIAHECLTRVCRFFVSSLVHQPSLLSISVQTFRSPRALCITEQQAVRVLCLHLIIC